MRIKTSQRGPLVIDLTEVDVTLYSAQGEEIDLGSRRKLLLCRCGQSKTTPICDGSHNRVGFHPENER